jgi:hypothetical protein
MARGGYRRWWRRCGAERLDWQRPVGALLIPETSAKE